MSAGKGDKPRPTKKKEWDKNYDRIDWVDRKSTPSNVRPAPGNKSVQDKRGS